jgi:hypothetical protein
MYMVDVGNWPALNHEGGAVNHNECQDVRCRYSRTWDEIEAVHVQQRRAWLPLRPVHRSSAAVQIDGSSAALRAREEETRLVGLLELLAAEYADSGGDVEDLYRMYAGR